MKATICLLAICSWLGVAIGTHLRLTSPRHQEWFEWETKGLKDFGPGPGLGFALAEWWVFVAIVSAVLWVLFFGSFALAAKRPASGQGKHWLLRAFSGAAAFAYILVAVLLIKGAASDFLWGFWVLATGEALGASSLLMAIMVIFQRPNTSVERTRALEGTRGSL